MSTASEPDASQLLRFVSTFQNTPPACLILTGGEPLLRPDLVSALAKLAKSTGTAVFVASGMFFAVREGLPEPIRQALLGVDHLVASIDEYHERHVPRRKVFTSLSALLEMGIDISVQTCAASAQDGYVTRLVEDVRERFDGQVPVFVTQLSSTGRATKLLAKHVTPSDGLRPCRLATWPVVTFDGTIVACCSQRAIDSPPNHLVVGHIAKSSWVDIQIRLTASESLRAIRALGPFETARQLSVNCRDGYCETCVSLGEKDALDTRLHTLVNSPKVRLIEEFVASMASDLPLHPIGGYADALKMGHLQ